jgi:hypothetical protein
MKLTRLQQLGLLNKKADEADIRQVELGVGKIPEDFQQFLDNCNGLYLNNGTKLYSTSEIVERNKTFEVDKYAPGYLMIGDDSGGLAILIPKNTKDGMSNVYVVDQGVLDADYMKLVSEGLIDWIENGCKLPE